MNYARHIFALLCMVFSFALPCCVAQSKYYTNTSLSVLRGIDLPLLDITTVSGTEPTADEAFPPDGAFGRSITNAVKLPASMTIVLGPDTLYDSGPYVADTSGLTIKLRGNTTAFQQQKPYKLTLEKKADLLLRGNDAIFRDRHWVLIAYASIDGLTGYRLSSQLGLDWTASVRCVNVRLNGQYIGLYMLVEQVRRNPYCRINVDKYDGWIVEHDPYWWNEPLYVHITGIQYYTFKHPDDKDITAPQLDYITSQLRRLHESLADGTFPDYIDMRSMALWLIGHDILGSSDAGGSNLYLTKFDSTPGSKFRATTLWDFGTTRSTRGKWSNLHISTYVFFAQMLASPNHEFLQTYVDTYRELEPWLFDAMDEWLVELKGSAELAAMERSRHFSRLVYNYYAGLFAEDIETMRRWLNERRVWMNAAMDEMAKQTSVDDLQNTSPLRRQLYDLAGRAVGGQDADGRGVVIERCVSADGTVTVRKTFYGRFSR